MFTFWGGDLWVFPIASYMPTDLETDVYRVNLTTGVAMKVTTLNFLVTSASSSTCAPVTIL